jgi:hypothetical protein
MLGHALEERRVISSKLTNNNKHPSTHAGSSQR